MWASAGMLECLSRLSTTGKCSIIWLNNSSHIRVHITIKLRTNRTRGSPTHSQGTSQRISKWSVWHPLTTTQLWGLGESWEDQVVGSHCKRCSEPDFSGQHESLTPMSSLCWFLVWHVPLFSTPYVYRCCPWAKTLWPHCPTVIHLCSSVWCGHWFLSIQAQWLDFWIMR
jgi:hypothetical protein